MSSKNCENDLEAIVEDDNIPFEKIKIRKKLGEGSFGTVFLGSLGGLDIAVKEVRADLDKNHEFQHEVAVLKALRHPNIVLFMGVSCSPQKSYIVQECIKGGALKNLLQEKNISISLRTCLRIAIEIAQGVVFMHQRECIHRDLKADNVLIDYEKQEGGNDINIKTVKISDFGLSRAVVTDGKILENVGSLWWRAPEVETGIYGPPVDIFSYGITLFEILTRETGEKIKTRMTFLKEKLTFGVDPKLLYQKPKFKAYFSMIPPALVHLAMDCCKENFQLRPTAEEVLNQLNITLKNLLLFEDHVTDQISTKLSGTDASPQDIKNGVQFWSDLVIGHLADDFSLAVPLTVLCNKINQHLETHTTRGLDETGRNFFASFFRVELNSEISLNQFATDFWPWYNDVFKIITNVLVSPYWSSGILHGFYDGTLASRKLIEKGENGVFILRFGSVRKTLVINCFFNQQSLKVLVKVAPDHFVVGTTTCYSLQEVFKTNNLHYLKTLYPNMDLNSLFHAHAQDMNLLSISLGSYSQGLNDENEPAVNQHKKEVFQELKDTLHST